MQIPRWELSEISELFESSLNISIAQCYWPRSKLRTSFPTSIMMITFL